MALVFFPSPSAGQTATTRGGESQPAGDAQRSVEATVQALARMIESQQKLLEEQGRQIELLRREIADTRGLTRPPSVEDTSSAQALPPTQVAGIEPAATTDQSPERVSEIPPDIVTAGDFPGAFRLPGSDAALRIGGLVRVNWVSTYNPLLVDDRFQTSAIPVAGRRRAGERQ